MSEKINQGTHTSGSNISFWIDSVLPVEYSELRENIKCDVVIVGGGISGLSVAYNLSKSGKKVVLVEDGFIGSGETGRTTAHLASALDDRYYELERIFGKEGSSLAAESHSAAISFIEETVRNEQIDCDFIRLSGYLYLHPSDKAENLDKEYEAAKNAGLDVELLDSVPGMKNSPGRCIRFANQGQFHPMKYLKGLAEAVIKFGGRIYTNTHAEEISDDGIVTAKGFRVEAGDAVVIASNSPVNNRYLMHQKQYPYRTYVVAAKVKKNSVKPGLWWDTGNHKDNKELPPYYYTRVQSLDEHHDLLICGGEDHHTGILEDDDTPQEQRYSNLEVFLRDHFNIEEVIYKWSGQVLEPMDGLAYIGKNPVDDDDVYIVTGDSGNGMTHGTIAGILISDLINNKKNPWEKIYSPSRFKLFSSGKTFFKELFGQLGSYVKNYPKDAASVSLSRLETGDGKIVEMDGKKYGAYRDDADDLHLVSANCTHVGCIIAWNKDEKSWDCPCHGSRFTHDGKVINGPANEDLKYHKEEKPFFLDKPGV